MKLQNSKQSRRSTVKRARSWFQARTNSERVLITVTSTLGLLWFLSWPISALSEYLDEVDALTAVRKQHYEELGRYVKRFREMDQKLTKLRASFDESQMTFEQVTSELDRIVQKSIGSSNYDLKKNRTPSQLGEDYEKQDFTLNIPNVTLEQLVSLLFEVEQGKSPLFMGKVDILQSGAEGSFRATLEIASISKSKSA